MEDSSLDWDEFEDDGEVEKESGFGWVLTKGLNLGKNLVITGVVVSSVPIVVPPLLVVSALGFAFSVPFGFMYASYTCTEKLMSKLLPNPSPHVIEYDGGEFVGSEEKEKGQLVDWYEKELTSENGVILVNESEEGFVTVGEFGKEEVGVQYDDEIRSEEGLRAVSEFGKDEEEEGVQYDDETRSEEGLSTVSELRKDGNGLQKNNVNTSEAGLSTGTECGKDEEEWKKDVNMSEEALSTGTVFGKDGEGLEEDDMNREEMDVNRASGVIMVADELDVPYKEDTQYGGSDDRERPVEEIWVEVNRSAIEESRETQATDDAISEVQTIPSADTKETDDAISEVQTIPSAEAKATVAAISEAQSIPSAETKATGAAISEVPTIPSAETEATDDAILEVQTIPFTETKATGAAISEVQTIPSAETKATGDATSEVQTIPTTETKATGAAISEVQTIPSAETKATDDAISEVQTIPFTETKATDAAISEVQTIPSAVTKSTDDAISEVQIIPSAETKATDDAISEVQIIPSAVETSDNKSKREVTHPDVEAKTVTKLGGERNETHGLKGMDKGKKRHTNAKGKKKTQKTQKRIEGDVSKAHEKDVVKPEIVSGKADVPLESENKLNLDKNETRLPAQDVAEEKITDVLMVSKDNDEPGNLRASIGDIDENKKNVVPPEKPRDQASNVSVLVPVLEVSDLKSVPVLIQHEELPELKDDSAHVEGNGRLRNKETLSHVEIWKQIDSIRKIVGFKVARHTSYFEEVKALYVFTGIEPPSLFKDPLDTSEVCEKLRFLMSVIGVK